MFHREDIQRHWASNPPPWWLRAVAKVYGGLTALRRGLYRLGWLRRMAMPVPVIVVGNISVGGTGKTPLVIALVAALRERGWRPGVVSRGYGGSATTPRLLGSRPEPRVCGDEPCLIAARTAAPVAIGRDRAVAARLLLAQGADIIIADDGLQHDRLHRDVEVCVIDGERRFGNSRLLPAGPLREPLARLQSVDFRVVNGGKARADEIAMQLVAGDAWRLGGPDDAGPGIRDPGPADSAVSAHGDSGLRPGFAVDSRDEAGFTPASCRPLAHWAGQRVHAVAGIGHPPRFFAALREHGVEIIEHAFADHHDYTVSDLSFADGLPVLMTEKDAVKCAGFDLADAWAVPVAAELPATFYEQVDARLRAESS